MQGLPSRQNSTIIDKMETTARFSTKVMEALQAHKAWLDRVEMPRLKDEFRLFQSSFTSLYTVLLKKGILHEDQYRNEAKIAEIEIPSESPFAENDRIDQMSIRLSNYQLQLDFLVNFYTFGVDFLNMERIKRLLSLTKYILWTQPSANSPNVNTRSLIELVSLVRGGNDQLSTALLGDAFTQLDRTSKNIFKYLKEVSDYHREAYKLELRLRIFDNMPLDASRVFTHHDETIKQIKHRFAEAMAGFPFYGELVEDILREDASAESAQLQADVLKRLAVPEEKPQSAAANMSFRHLLTEGIRILGSLYEIVNDAYRKILDNSAMLEASRNSFWDKVRRLVNQMLNREGKAIVYELEFFDPVTTSSKTEEINFTQFMEDMERKMRMLSALGNRNSQVWKRLDAVDDEQLLNALVKNIDDTQALTRILVALDVFFKSEMPREERERVRGIKPEISAIKGSIMTANQKRHEYIAQKEEQAQLKRLGIKTDLG